MTDNVIVEKIRAKEESGLELLIDTYGNYVSAILCNISKGVLHSEDAEELAADVFLSIWYNIDRFQTGSPLKPYLAQTARNAAISRMRKQKPEAIPFDDDILIVSKDGNPEDSGIKNDCQLIINTAASQLDEPDREIFIRFYYFGEKINAIGQRLHLNPATVKTKLHRCRKQIKKIFEARGYFYYE